ncbi:MAG: hypothetical protein HYR91_11670 [Flavobacteriia bacterium]|nr:hypothetical protein [Flavobacteriia bacterium]
METEEISFPNEKIQELRDIHFFRNEILAMQSGSTGLIIHSSKNINFIEKTSKWENVFLDGFDVKDSIAFMMGDPINGFFSLYKNVSNKWELCEGKIAAIEGEAGFAASGTNVQIVNDSTFIFVSGGAQSRFFKTMNQGKTWTSISLPFDKGDGIGAFSVHFKDNLNGVIVGGNYLKPTETIHTSFYTKDGGLTWNLSKTNVNGYRSAVCYFNKRYYACGTNGIDFSKDNGKTWEKLSDGNYFAIYPIQQNGSSRLFATTTNGTVKVFKIK